MLTAVPEPNRHPDIDSVEESPRSPVTPTPPGTGCPQSGCFSSSWSHFKKFKRLVIEAVCFCSFEAPLTVSDYKPSSGLAVLIWLVEVLLARCSTESHEFIVHPPYTRPVFGSLGYVSGTKSRPSWNLHSLGGLSYLYFYWKRCHTVTVLQRLGGQEDASGFFEGGYLEDCHLLILT